MISQLLQGAVLDALRADKALGEEAFTKRINQLAGATFNIAGDIVSEFDAIVARESRAASEGTLIDFAKGFTPTASVIELFNQGVEMAKSFSTDDKTVNFSLTIEMVGDALTFVPRFSGKGNTTSTGTNISGWAAYERGIKKGDTFEIRRVSKGEFRDVSRGEDIPQRGMVKWILTHYPDSKASVILGAAGKTL